MTGKLVVFDGLDGSGKTTTAREFEVKLWESGVTNTVLTHEPFGEAAAGEWLRTVLRKEVPATPRMMAMAFALNRLDHCQRWIAPALAQGKIVICDRYMMSSLVYNPTVTGRGAHATNEGVSESDIRFLNTGAIKPDVTFFLHASEATCLERIRARGGATELYEDRLHEMVNRYLKQVEEARQQGVTVHWIDADAPADNVLAQVIAYWDQHL